MRNAKPLEQVRCYTQGCKDTSLYCGPACDSCWHQLREEERNIIKKEFNKDCDQKVYVPSINKLCSIYGCYRPVQLKGGAAADGRCSTCRGEGKMSTVVDTGVEKEEAAPPSLSSLSLSSLSQSPPRNIGAYTLWRPRKTKARFGQEQETFQRAVPLYQRAQVTSP